MFNTLFYMNKNLHAFAALQKHGKMLRERAMLQWDVTGIPCLGYLTFIHPGRIRGINGKLFDRDTLLPS